MTKNTIATVANDIGYIKESIKKVEEHLEKLNGSVQSNKMGIQQNGFKICDHLDDHKMERESKFKWIAAVTSMCGIIISIMYFLKT